MCQRSASEDPSVLSWPSWELVIMSLKQQPTECASDVVKHGQFTVLFPDRGPEGEEWEAGASLSSVRGAVGMSA